MRAWALGRIGHVVAAVNPVEYEELAASPTESFRRITDFLGVLYVAPTASTVQQNPLPLRLLLANFDELRASARGSALEQFFVEE